ncbi:hypothetical protein ACFWZO_27975, partial [Streptomyces sp. NPDC059015]
MSAAPSKEPAGAGALAELTEREREVTVLVDIGLPGEEIARRLVACPPTARTHVGRTTVEPGARDRARSVVPGHDSRPVRRPARADQG